MIALHIPFITSADMNAIISTVGSGHGGKTTFGGNAKGKHEHSIGITPHKSLQPIVPAKVS